MYQPRVVVSAPHRSSGKTTLSIGLCAALTQLGHKVQPFKKGPDFIDPMWLSAASGFDCHNLDLFMMDRDTVLYSFQRAADGSDIAVIEGNMGFYDGLDLGGQGSTADLSRLLGAPVVLIVDTSNMTRSIAPLILGFQKFDPEANIVGVILNKVANSRHESKLTSTIEHYLDIKVAGSIPRLSKIGLLQRHLGLRPAKEDDAAAAVISSIADIVKEHVDLNTVMDIARSAPELPGVSTGHVNKLNLDPQNISPSIKLAVARDKAFTFYYPENLEALRAAGAELVYFSPLEDTRLPEANGLYIGGGFPEVFMGELEANQDIRKSIRSAIEAGMPSYAECGGLMYLSRSISWDETTKQMVGAIPCDIKMHEKPRGHGYIQLETNGLSWINIKDQIKAHEFHYSEATNLGDVQYAYKVLRGHGVDGQHDGILYKNLIASYAHLHSLGTPQWADNFVSFVRSSGFSS